MKCRRILSIALCIAFMTMGSIPSFAGEITGYGDESQSSYIVVTNTKSAINKVLDKYDAKETETLAKTPQSHISLIELNETDFDSVKNENTIFSVEKDVKSISEEVVFDIEQPSCEN